MSKEIMKEANWIVPNGNIEIDTVLRFDDTTHLMAFLKLAKDKRCNVRFDNEDIEVMADKNIDDVTDVEITAKTAFYYMLKHNPNMLAQFIEGINKLTEPCVIRSLK